MLNAQPQSATNTHPVERRSFQRVTVSVFGRFMLEDKSEYACQIVNMSPGSAAFATPCPGRLGEHIVVYADHLGRLEGTIARIYDGGFAMTIEASYRKRDKFSAKLTWLANQGTLGLPEDRRHERVIPRDPKTDLTLEDGRKYRCHLIDLSVSGAAVKADVRPAIGSIVTLGTSRGRVVRHFDEGIALSFFGSQEN